MIKSVFIVLGLFADFSRRDIVSDDSVVRVEEMKFVSCLRYDGFKNI